MEELPLQVNSSANRFELKVESSVAYIDYKLKRKLLFLIHTEVPEALRGKGIGSLIVKKVLEYAKNNGYQIVPVCTFVQSFLKRHPEWAQLQAPNADRFLDKPGHRD